MIRIKRAYDPPQADDGERILVDRLWPRGTTKESIRLSSWLKDIGPSTELRKRYGRELHRPEQRALMQDLAERSRRGVVTLLFAAKDETRNNAVVLKERIENIAGNSY